MNVTAQGVYLVTNGDEHFIGNVGDILDGYYIPGFPGEGISFRTLIMDIVQEIVSDPLRSSETITIKIRD